jgi:hypothetical protein
MLGVSVDNIVSAGTYYLHMVTEKSCDPNVKISIYLKFLFYNWNYTYNLTLSARNVQCGQQRIHSLQHVTSNLMVSYCPNIQVTVFDVLF